MNTKRQSKFLRIATLLLAAALVLLCTAGCTAFNKRDNIVVLFTNDVHNAVDSAIGYAGLAAYKESVKAKTPHVTLVDCGDAIQGDVIGSVSKGEYLVDIMNKVGYDLAIPGNHEFDFGMPQLSALLEKANAKYLGSNIRYTGDNETITKQLAPYQIISYGKVDVAFVGVLTPENITKSTPSYFMDEDGNFVYDFYGGNNGADLYENIQKTVDTCREEGADYVIALSHLGIDEASAPYRSTDLIANTTDIDAVLDGHSHDTIPCQIVENKNKQEVLLSSTGTGLVNIGQLIIHTDGSITTGLITGYTKTDAGVADYIKTIQSSFEADMNKVVGQGDTKLSVNSEAGIRLVRIRETNIGNFCADAYRTIAGADIAFVNGGGIRADLPAGDITYGDIIAVHPYGNTLCVAEATGQEILDALEMASRDVLPKLNDGEYSVGENGGFLQVSGLKYTVDTSVKADVTLDENGMFVSCGNTRRVKDVQVLAADGSYTPIDAKKVYTLASHNYLIKQGGDGLSMFMDNTLPINEGMSDYQILITYIADYLDGTVGKNYANTQGRITVK